MQMVEIQMYMFIVKPFPMISTTNDLIVERGKTILLKIIQHVETYF